MSQNSGYHKFEELMKKHDLNIYILSTRCGVSTSSLYNWKTKNRTPSLRVCKRLAKYFKVPVSTFYNPNEVDVERTTDRQKRKSYRDEFELLQSYAPTEPITSYEELLKHPISRFLTFHPKTPDDVRKNFCVFLAAYKISVDDLAKILYIGKSTVWCWKHGVHTPQKKGAVALGEYFNAPVELFFYKNNSD